MSQRKREAEQKKPSRSRPCPPYRVTPPSKVIDIRKRRRTLPRRPDTLTPPPAGSLAMVA